MAQTKIERSVVVNVPVTTAYNQWTQFEEFPRFMEGVDAVEQLDATRLRWRAHVGPKTVEWNSEIVSQVPDTLISWRSTSGAENSGEVRFTAQGPAQTRVDLLVQYVPEGFFESVADALGAVARRVGGDLERFKTFLEARGTATGAWRGAIRGGDVASAPAPTPAAASSRPYAPELPAADGFSEGLDPEPAPPVR